MDSIFKSYDIRGKVGTELTEEFSHNTGKAFADWLPNPGIVAVGRDMRPDSEELARSFISGLIAQGREVWDLGQITSDMAYFAVGKFNLAGCAVITASHNPGAYNGIKLYRDEVIPVGLDSGLDSIRDAVLSANFKPEASEAGTIVTKDIKSDWVEHVLSFIKELKPFNIAIDAGNGMAGAILPDVLPKLPVRAIEMYFTPDGTFPNHQANPQEVENLQDLITCVTENNLDFGIAFDGDGDRAGFVDDKGRPVLGTDLLSIVAGYYLKQYPNSQVVHDVRTSRATVELIKEWGGTPMRTKAGRVNIGAYMRKIGAPFGGETTGHMFFKENYDADSGMIVALVTMQALSDSGKKLSELVDEYRRYVMPPEINFETSKSKDEVFKQLSELYSDAEIDMLDGITVSYPDRWFNLRASNTEPLMRLNVEAASQEMVDNLIDQIKEVIS